MPDMSGDPSQAITEFLEDEQASQLTSGARNLTKAQMLSAMYAFANGGKLTEGLEKSDIQSIRAAFAQRYDAIGVASTELGGSCCCCCTAVATSAPDIGRFSFAAVSDVSVAFASPGPEAEEEEGASCCCCCCI
jgi:hypothetical protein